MPLLIEFNAKDRETIPKECATWQNLIFFHMNFLHIYIYIYIYFFFFENEDYFFYKNQTRSAKSTSYRCGGISSTHTDKPLTCLACLARL